MTKQFFVSQNLTVGKRNVKCAEDVLSDKSLRDNREEDEKL